MVAHVYVALIGLLAFSIIVGGIILSDQRPQAVSSVGTWNRAGGFTFVGNENGSSNPAPSYQPATPLATGAAGDYVPIQIQKQEIQSEPSLLDEWQSLLMQITEQRGPTESKETSATTDAYSFIPTGLISAVTPTRERTPEVDALYTYGNQVGALIRAFDESHTDMIVVLKDAYADRSNIQKRKAAEEIGLDYETLGQQLETLSDIPPAVAPMHRAIAQSYQEAGKKLIVKLRTQTDEEFLAAMHAYNASALTFTNNFVALATYLSANGVKFATTDPGSVFTFTSF